MGQVTVDPVDVAVELVDIVVLVELPGEKKDFSERLVLLVIPSLAVAVKWRLMIGPVGQFAVLS